MRAEQRICHTDNVGHDRASRGAMRAWRWRFAFGLAVVVAAERMDSFGGKRNRTSLKHCIIMMQRLRPSFLLVWIGRGADADCGPMRYPPLTALTGAVPAANGRSRSPGKCPCSY
jgi:hypothetical protein